MSAFTRPKTRASPRPKLASTEATLRLPVTGRRPASRRSQRGRIVAAQRPTLVRYASWDAVLGWTGRHTCLHSKHARETNAHDAAIRLRAHRPRPVRGPHIRP